jgi:hypothetical protein
LKRAALLQTNTQQPGIDPQETTPAGEEPAEAFTQIATQEPSGKARPDISSDFDHLPAKGSRATRADTQQLEVVIERAEQTTEV